jgi:hypothetical protein
MRLALLTTAVLLPLQAGDSTPVVALLEEEPWEWTEKARKKCLVFRT